MIEMDGRLLILPHGHVRKFDDSVLEVIPFDDAVIVRIAAESGRRSNENVYAVDYRGNVIWQIPWRSHLCEFSPYVAIYRNNNHVDAYNWDGHDLTLDSRTGLLIQGGFLPGGPPPPRRPPPPRHFI